MASVRITKAHELKSTLHKSSSITIVLGRESNWKALSWVLKTWAATTTTAAAASTSSSSIAEARLPGDDSYCDSNARRVKSSLCLQCPQEEAALHMTSWSLISDDVQEFFEELAVSIVWERLCIRRFHLFPLQYLDVLMSCVPRDASAAVTAAACCSTTTPYKRVYFMHDNTYDTTRMRAPMKEVHPLFQGCNLHFFLSCNSDWKGLKRLVDHIILLQQQRQKSTSLVLQGLHVRFQQGFHSCSLPKHSDECLVAMGKLYSQELILLSNCNLYTGGKPQDYSALFISALTNNPCLQHVRLHHNQQQQYQTNNQDDADKTIQVDELLRKFVQAFESNKSVTNVYIRYPHDDHDLKSAADEALRKGWEQVLQSNASLEGLQGICECRNFMSPSIAMHLALNKNGKRKQLLQQEQHCKDNRMIQPLPPPPNAWIEWLVSMNAHQCTTTHSVVDEALQLSCLYYVVHQNPNLFVSSMQSFS